jgi:hypothetical protein
MAIGVSHLFSGNMSGSGSSRTVNVTVPSGTTKLVALLRVGVGNATQKIWPHIYTTVNWKGSQEFTHAVYQTPNNNESAMFYTYIRYLDNPSSGYGTFTTTATNTLYWATSLNLLALNKTKNGHYAAGNGALWSPPVTSPSVTLSAGPVSGIVFDTLYIKRSGVNPFTVGANQTQLINWKDYNIGYAASYEVGSGNRAMTWSFDWGAEHTVLHSAVSFEEKITGGNRIWGGVFIERAKEILKGPVLEQFPLTEPEHPLGSTKRGGLLIPQGV